MYRLFISTSPSKSGRNRLRPKFFRGSRLTLGACRGTPLFIRSKAKLLSDCLTEVFTLLPRTDLKLGFSLAATKSLSFEKLAERTEWLPLYFNNWFGGGTIFFGSSTWSRCKINTPPFYFYLNSPFESWESEEYDSDSSEDLSDEGSLLSFSSRLSIFFSSSSMRGSSLCWLSRRLWKILIKSELKW